MRMKVMYTLSSKDFGTFDKTRIINETSTSHTSRGGETFCGLQTALRFGTSRKTMWLLTLGPQKSGTLKYEGRNDDNLVLKANKRI